MTEPFEDDAEAGARFEAAGEADADEAFIVDVGAWEGPLHLLLALARKKKVDLSEISILALADQYLDFIEHARRTRLDLAAEYLVMAAWLAYLKSRLLLPKPRADEDAPEPEAMAAALAFRLLRLDAMRAAGAALFAGTIDQRDVFPRGAPEGVRSITSPRYEAELYDLLKAYARRREALAFRSYKPRPQPVYALETARLRLGAVVRGLEGWAEFDALLPGVDEAGEAVTPRSIRASSLLAALEIAKEGHADLRQEGVFEPIWMRARKPEAKS